MFFAVMGLQALGRPESLPGNYGIERVTAGYRNEIRAVYGGFGLGVAVLLVTSILREDLRFRAETLIGAALLAMAAGRLLSFAVDGPTELRPLLLCATELGFGAGLIHAGRARSRGKGSGRGLLH